MLSRLGILIFTLLIGLSNVHGLYAQGDQEIVVPKIYLFDDLEKAVLVTIKPTQRERYHFSVKKKDDGKADQEEDTKATFSLPYSSVELLQAAIEKHTNYFVGKDDADANQNEIKKVWDLIHFAETIGNNILDGDGPVAGKLSIQDTATKVYWVERNYTYRGFFRNALKKSLKSEWKRNQSRSSLLEDLESLGFTTSKAKENQTPKETPKETPKDDWSANKYWRKYRKQLKLISDHKNKKHHQWEVYLEKRAKEFDAKLKQSTDVCDSALQEIQRNDSFILTLKEKIENEKAALAEKKKALEAVNLRIKATEQDRDSVLVLWESKAPKYFYVPKGSLYNVDSLEQEMDKLITLQGKKHEESANSITDLRSQLDSLPLLIADSMLIESQAEIRRIEILNQIDAQKDIEINARDQIIALGKQKSYVRLFAKRLNEITSDISELNAQKKDLKSTFAGEERRTAIKIKSWNDSIQSLNIENKRLIRTINAKGSEIKEELIPKNQAFAFVIKSVQIEFSKGYIENIKVIGELISELKCSCFIQTDSLGTSAKDAPTRIIRNITFHNPAPIGFSRKMDYGSLQYQALYSRDEDYAYALLLGDVIENYDFELYQKRRDYSPGDEYEPTKIEGGESATLNKTSTYKLFQGKVYTDFLGLNDQNPNGILQLNANKDINLLTQRYVFRNPFASSLYKVFYPGGIQFSFLNIGLITSIQPSATLSKVEKNLRDLDLSFKPISQGGQTEQIAYVSTLDLKRHEQASIGVKANVFLLDWPALKSTISWNNYFYFGNVVLRDTINGFINTDENRRIANTFQLGSEISIDILPDERYSLWMSYSWNTYLLSDNIAEQVADGDLFLNTGRNENARKFRGINVRVRFTPKPDSPNQLYLNVQRYYQKNLWNTNFHQIQLGYSFYLLSNYRKPVN